MKNIIFIFLLSLFAFKASASVILVPMDEKQTNHLKAYGIVYWVIGYEVDAYWLLNYRGGSFAFMYSKEFEKECKTRGVSFEVISDAAFANIQREIGDPEVNQDFIKLEKAPKIAVYTPDFNPQGGRLQPWDDAVTLVLSYAEIPYDKVYDREVIHDKLALYDWLHLHHEDFTGQYGKFWAGFQHENWYKENQRKQEQLATDLGFSKVSQVKLAVVKKIREYVGGGGFMFAMCSATDSYDVALAADGLDICGPMFDGDPADPDAEKRLDYSKTFAFKDFKLEKNPVTYEISTIDNQPPARNIDPRNDYFNLFDFSAKWDPIPTMLTQCHTRTVKGFMGQTTAFHTDQIKSGVLIMGETKPLKEARYIHGEFGKGQWTFYGGHDPEDYQHRVQDPETDLNLHPQSPGYRLILNNILFPAAKKKQRKT